jgi:hypothetical protein
VPDVSSSSRQEEEREDRKDGEDEKMPAARSSFAAVRNFATQPHW